MSQLFTEGKVVSDLVLKWSEKSKRHYAYFTVAEQLGYGERMRHQYIQVWAFGPAAEHLANRKVSKHSSVWVSGSVELAEFMRGGTTKDKGLKLYLASWGFVSDGVPTMTLEMEHSPESAAAASDAVKQQPMAIEVIRGDKDILPE